MKLILYLFWWSTVTPQKFWICRPCYFTAESTNKKADFIKCLNSSYKVACLQCSFTDKELGEFIQYKKRNTQLPKKFAVTMVGQQPDGSWVMASNIYLSPTGEMINPASSEYVWIGHVYNGPGVASDAQQCQIELPLTTDPLCNLMENLRVSMRHNFMPTVMTMASTILALHYRTMLQKLKCCPVPLAFGM